MGPQDETLRGPDKCSLVEGELLDLAQARSCCEETRRMLEEGHLDRFDLVRAALPNVHLILWTVGQLFDERSEQEGTNTLRLTLQRLNDDFTNL
jgi:hypothetical protein